MFPLHGRLTCRRCFNSETDSEKYFDDRRFRLLPPPAAYGASDPLIAVLGMTYGQRQNAIHHNEAFESKAFAGFRDRLDRLLRRVGIFSERDTCDQRIRSDEKDFAFGSVVRCSVMGLDKEHNDYSSRSDLVIPAFSGQKEANITIKNCIDQHLKSLPPRLRLVLLLGNSSSYINIVGRELKVHHFDYKRIGAKKKAHFAGGVYWVHLTHPSKGNYTHFEAYLTEPDNVGQGEVREDAIKAIKMSGVCS